MKTQTWSSRGYPPLLTARSLCGLQQSGTRCDAATAYREARENGHEKDGPKYKFPQDGKFTWTKGRVEGEYVYGVKESDGYYHYEVRYDEGIGDKKWMEEKDRNYLARLYLLGANDDVERQDLKENSQRAKEAAEEIRKLPLSEVSDALKKFLENEKKEQEEARRKKEEEILTRLKMPKFVMQEKSCEEQRQILQRLKDNTCVKELVLRGLTLSKEILENLFALLKGNEVLQVLDLSNCQLTDETIKPLIDILRTRQNITLSTLKLDANAIKRARISQIDSYLKRNAHLSGEKPSDTTSIDSSRVKIPHEFECVITSQIMLDPVMTYDGHTYEREAIEGWLEKKNTSPKTGKVLPKNDLLPNSSMKATIATFLEQNPGLWQTDLIYQSKELKAKLLEAVAKADTNDIKRYVDMDQRFLWKTLSDADTLLKLACKQHEPKVLNTVITLLSNYISGDLFWQQLEDGDGRDYFQLAARAMGAEGARFVAKKLEWNEADLQQRLIDAIQDGDQKIVAVCLLLGAKLSTKDAEGNYPVHLAVIGKKLEILRYFIAQRADLEVTDKDNNTPLHLAAKAGDNKIIRCLLKAGANTKAKNSQKQKPTQVARAAGKPNTATFIEQLKLQIALRPFILPLQQEIKALKEIVRSLGGKLPDEEEPTLPNASKFEALSTSSERKKEVMPSENRSEFFNEQAKTPSTPSCDDTAQKLTSEQLPMILIS